MSPVRQTGLYGRGVLQPEEITRVLVVTAHPDDVDFGAAGSVATWTSRGVEVAYCICTDGDAGGFDPAVPRGDIGGIRQAEQRAAAKEVGVEDVVFLGHPDGALVPDLVLRRDISRQVRRVRPDLVVTQSPTRNFARIYASHPDHLAAGEAALCAVYPDARNPFAHPALALEGYEAWTAREVWLMGSPTTDVVVDVTDHYDAKKRALLAHESQRPGMPGGGADLDGLLHGWLGSQAQAGGLPEGRLAEAFLRVETS